MIYILLIWFIGIALVSLVAGILGEEDISAPAVFWPLILPILISMLLLIYLPNYLGKVLRRRING